MDTINKIKVYIKEPNTPEYIQLWDNFDKEKSYEWLLTNKNIYIENNLALEEEKEDKSRLIIHKIGDYRFGTYPTPYQ